MDRVLFHIDSAFVPKALFWASRQRYAVALNNHNPDFPLQGFPNQIAISNGDALVLNAKDLRQDIAYYGYISYDYKNEIEALYSENPSYIHFPDFFFFESEVLLEFVENQVYISSKDPHSVFEHIQACLLETDSALQVQVKPLTPREMYLQYVSEIIDHIHRGNIYEVNYCVGFCASEVVVDPVLVYHRLVAQSPTPFACFVKYEEQFLMCASPERYFKIQDNKVVSQPIKGTGRVQDVNNVHQEISKLKESAKERNENVMIVDLVRNDLSKVCVPGTVKVDELFGVYRFSNLYQMISTVSGVLEEGRGVVEVLEASFPMGSMTGAPKYKSMQLIEQYENFRRNIYSGAVGYIKPNGDADFNVVIRSLFYDRSKKQLSFAVGSGITAMSNPVQEYEECMLKAENMMKAVNSLQ